MTRTCWACKNGNDGTTPAGDYENKPERGDASICAYCSAISIFDREGPHLVLRKPTPDELLEFLRSDEIQAALAMWRRQWKPEWGLKDTV